jgi:hypothetical protein
MTVKNTQIDKKTTKIAKSVQNDPTSGERGEVPHSGQSDGPEQVDPYFLDQNLNSYLVDKTCRQQPK